MCGHDRLGARWITGRLLRALIAGLVAAGITGGVAAYYFQHLEEQDSFFRTARVTRGDLLVSISATGTVEPEEVINVGAQVAGQIVSFGKDSQGKMVDYGSSVREGTVLAKIDDSLHTAEAAQAEAQVQSAKAGVQRAEADLEQMRAKLYQAERDWLRAQKLGPSEALSQATYDAYKSAYETALANVAVGKAAVLQAKAGLAQAEAAYARARRNVDYCTIKSPVSGVVIDRRVNIGQTVVASLNAPSLFLLAKDLKRMQVWVAVNEADIGKIRPGQPVSFTVDAFPGEVFRGQVRKVRLNASMTQNVVAYTVEVVTDNSDGRLLPYLTANVKFELERRTDVLMVPNSALRWHPAPHQVEPNFHSAFLEEMSPAPKGDDRKRPWAGTAAGSPAQAVLWVPKGSFVRPVPVKVGLSDNVMTEVEGEGLSEGTEVVVGTQDQPSPTGASTNPFVPKPPGRGAGPPPPPS